MSRTATAPRKSSCWMWWGAVAVVGVLGAVTVPECLRYGLRARQTEARVNLWAIYKAESAFYAKHARYGTFDEIEFSPSKEYVGRYTYRLNRSGRPGTMIPATAWPVAPDNPLTPAVIDDHGQHFTATATGNIDGDLTVDAWHVNDGGAGLSEPDINDVTE